MHLQASAPAMPHVGTTVSGYAWELAKVDAHLFLPPLASQPSAPQGPIRRFSGAELRVIYRSDC